MNLGGDSLIWVVQVRGHPRGVATVLGHPVAAVMEVSDLESVRVEAPIRVVVLGAVLWAVQLEVLGDSYPQQMARRGTRSVLCVVDIIPGLADRVPQDVFIVISLDIS